MRVRVCNIRSAVVFLGINLSIILFAVPFAAVLVADVIFADVIFADVI